MAMGTTVQRAVLNSKPKKVDGGDEGLGCQAEGLTEVAGFPALCPLRGRNMWRSKETRNGTQTLNLGDITGPTEESGSHHLTTFWKQDRVASAVGNLVQISHCVSLDRRLCCSELKHARFPRR